MNDYNLENDKNTKAEISSYACSFVTSLIEDVNENLNLNPNEVEPDLKKVDAFASSLINDLFGESINTSNNNSIKIDDSSSLIESSTLNVDSHNK